VASAAILQSASTTISAIEARKNAMAINGELIFGDLSAVPRGRFRGVLPDDSESISRWSEALRSAVVPFDEDLHVIGVEDSPTEPDAYAKLGPEQLDSIAFAG
jgi:hypothetical protein